jgi:phosphoglycolate phosphatase
MSRIFRVDAIACDLDGTLVDSVPDLASAVDATLADFGLPPVGEAQVRTWVGNGAAKLVARALTGDSEGNPPAAHLTAALDRFHRHYGENLCVGSRLYDGVLEGLLALATLGYPLACVSNKPDAFAWPLLERLGIADHFEIVVGGDTAPAKKPAPDALLMVAERLRVELPKLLLVGDSVNDVGAARAARCPVVCVPYGYNHGEDIRHADPDAMIESLADLPALLPAETRCRA